MLVPYWIRRYFADNYHTPECWVVEEMSQNENIKEAESSGNNCLEKLKFYVTFSAAVVGKGRVKKNKRSVEFSTPGSTHSLKSDTSGGDQVVCQASAPFLCSSSWSPSWWTPPSPPSTTTSWRSRWSAESSSANTYSVIIPFYHVILWYHVT